MQVSVVAFLHVTQTELRNRSAFEHAARFTKWESIITIRCDATGEELQVTCTPPEHAKPGTTICHGWRHFYQAWVRKNGPIE